MQRVVQRLSGGEVRPEGLFDHEAAEPLVLPREAGLPERVRGGDERRRGQRQVEECVRGEGIAQGLQGVGLELELAVLEALEQLARDLRVASVDKAVEVLP